VFPSPGDVSISAKSTLVVEGPGSVIIKKLALDGALILKAEHTRAVIAVDCLLVSNDGSVSTFSFI
jgi:hypothetical protein